MSFSSFALTDICCYFNTVRGENKSENGYSAEELQ